MGQSKQQWIDETGGFRLDESDEIRQARTRMLELREKLRGEGWNEGEREEYQRLADLIPDE